MLFYFAQHWDLCISGSDSSSLQATRAVTKVDGLPRAPSFENFWKKWWKSLKMACRDWECFLVSKSNTLWLVETRYFSLVEQYYSFQEKMACRDEILSLVEQYYQGRGTIEFSELSYYMYGWIHKIEHILRSCRQIWVRITHPEVRYGSLVWSKAHVWENSVEKVAAVYVF